MLHVIHRLFGKCFPIILQKDSMQCGIACLSMISSYYGRSYSLDFLSKKCFPTKEGVSLLSISKAAKQIGLDNITGLISLEELMRAPLPCILHWSQNHFVVLYKVKNVMRFMCLIRQKEK